MKKTGYRVWYHPYGYPDESDFIDLYTETEEAAIRTARSLGYVEETEYFEYERSE